MIKYIELSSGSKIKYYDVLGLAEFELDACNHLDSERDYNSELDFYLSNIKNTNYAQSFIPVFMSSVDAPSYTVEEIEEIRILAVDKIKEILN